MKKKSLLVKVFVTSFVMVAVTMILSGLILFTLFYSQAEKNMEKNLRDSSSVACYQVVHYQSINWLIPYWREHYEDMSLYPFEDIDAYIEWIVERGEFESANTAGITTEEVLLMDEERQRLFAEYCYFQIYFELAVHRSQMEINSITCFTADESDNEAFVFFFIPENDEGPLKQRLFLGDEWSFDPEEHTEYIRLIGSDLEINSGIDIYSSDDGNDCASMYSRIERDRNTSAVLSLTVSMKEITDGVWSDVFEFEKWIALVILAAIGIPLLIFYLSSLRPILKLQRDIRSYTGERSAAKLYSDLEKMIGRGDEIGRLAGDIKEMVEQNELYYNQEIENEKLKTKILLAQIKPHFIYNCLSAIRSLMDEPEKAEDTLNHFAGFLRGSMDVLENTDCIRADREFETVENYLYMEKRRFEDQLSIVTDLRDKNFFLPAFSVQMLVENAVNHGIRGTKRGRGTVYIRSYEEDGFHVIEVEDDGAGIPPKKTEEDKREERLHIGLNNIEKRLRVMCEGSLTIRGEEGKGTLAVIRIPKDFLPSSPT